jgi:single-stranded DNA-binding protein
MLNQLVLIGKIEEIITKENVVKIRVEKYYKEDGLKKEYEIFRINVFGNLINTMKENCKKNDVIGVKGKLEVNNGIIEIIAEKITFLSNKKENE